MTLLYNLKVDNNRDYNRLYDINDKRKEINFFYYLFYLVIFLVGNH